MKLYVSVVWSTAYYDNEYISGIFSSEKKAKEHGDEAIEVELDKTDHISLL